MVRGSRNIASTRSPDLNCIQHALIMASKHLLVLACVRKYAVSDTHVAQPHTTTICHNRFVRTDGHAGRDVDQEAPDMAVRDGLQVGTDGVDVPVVDEVLALGVQDVPAITHELDERAPVALAHEFVELSGCEVDGVVHGSPAVLRLCCA